MRNDKIANLANVFARERSEAGCAGRMTVVPNEAWSYDEQIAFRDEDGVVYVTKKKFSPTTSTHVGFIRRELGRAAYLNGHPDEPEGWEVWKKKR